MTTTLVTPQLQNLRSIRLRIDSEVNELIGSLPDTKLISAEQRRGIIARYCAVLEGNFIYWMTAAYLSVRSEEARPVIIDNLREEVGDCHPEMLRKFAIAAHAFPTDTDALAMGQSLTNVRLFLGRQSGVPNLITMGFFESCIQRLMPYLAELAQMQGSEEMVYTDVHGVCDIAHSEGLFFAVSAEMEINPPDPTVDLFEGVTLLRGLIQDIVQ